MLSTGEFHAIPANWSPRARVGGRALGGILAAVEIWNSVVAPLVQGIETHNRTFEGENLVPFIRRLLFWQQMGVMPKVVGVHDPWIGSPTEERRPGEVIRKLNAQEWDALFFDAGPRGSREPGIADADVFKLGIWLSYNIRNFDEFATLFKDSGQDAMQWETPEGKAWDEANWFVRVGHYETEGSNHVVERWEKHARLTELMRVFVKSIITNTERLLEARLHPEQRTDQLTREVGELEQLPSTFTRRAALVVDSDKTTVSVPCLGDPGGSPSVIDREVDWFGTPEFLVHSVSGSRTLVSGADYNTYVVLRSLRTLKHTLWLAGPNGPLRTSETVRNQPGTVWISSSLLTQPASARPAPAAPTSEPPRQAPAPDILRTAPGPRPADDRSRSGIQVGPIIPNDGGPPRAGGVSIPF